MMRIISFTTFTLLIVGLFFLGRVNMAYAGDSERDIFDSFSASISQVSEPSEIVLQDEKMKSPHLSKNPATQFMDRGIYLNQAGDVIIDARLLKNLYMNEKTVTCTVCHKKVNLKNVYSHYKDTKHRFFTRSNLQ